MWNSGISLGLAACVLVLAGCEQRETVLPGERLGVREVLQTRGTTRDIALIGANNASVPLDMPEAQANADWTQSPVSPFARVTNLGFATGLEPYWSADIGAGDTRRARILADPVADSGRIYTIDSSSRVQATSAGGAALWSASLVPLRESAGDAQGGGLALGDGRLYATSGYGTLTAFDVETGDELWMQRLGSAATGAPSYRDGLVYVTSGDDTGWAIEAEFGRVRWQADGTSDVENVAGAPAPAIGEDLVLFSYGSGAVSAAFRQGGLRRWNADVSGRRTGVALANVDDLTGDPVIAGEAVYAGNHAGRFVALDLASGSRLWTSQMGALGPAWPVGDSLFLVSDRNTLVRLDAGTGDMIWEVELPGWQDRRNPSKGRDAAYANHGPILAGGRLIVASSDGRVRAFNPEDGALLEEAEIPGGATARPIVVNETLYVVSSRGVLHAYR